MTRDEAIAEAQIRNAAGGGDGFWAAREQDGAWQVVQVSVEGLVPRRPTGTHAAPRDQPEVQEDPRPVIFQNLPPYGFG